MLIGILQCDEVFPQSPADCDAYLITGSRAGVYEDHPWIEPASALVRRLLGAHKPVVGICFGHQLLAQAGHFLYSSAIRTRCWICAGKQLVNNYIAKAWQRWPAMRIQAQLHAGF